MQMPGSLSRRSLLVSSVTGAALTSTGLLHAAEQQAAAEPFSLKFAPHIGLLTPEDGLFRHSAGSDPAD